MGFFPIDQETVNYLRATGRSEEHCKLYENYYRAQKLFGMPDTGDIVYSRSLELDLGSIVSSVAGPKRTAGWLAITFSLVIERRLNQKGTDWSMWPCA